MKRRNFIKKAGQLLLLTSAVSVTGVSVINCSNDDDDDG